MRLNKSQKKQLEELQNLVDKHGYWSEEVNNYNSSLSYDDCKAINLYVKKTHTKNHADEKKL